MTPVVKAMRGRLNGLLAILASLRMRLVQLNPIFVSSHCIAMCWGQAATMNGWARPLMQC